MPPRRIRAADLHIQRHVAFVQPELVRPQGRRQPPAREPRRSGVAARRSRCPRDRCRRLAEGTYSKRALFLAERSSDRRGGSGSQPTSTRHRLRAGYSGATHPYQCPGDFSSDFSRSISPEGTSQTAGPTVIASFSAGFDDLYVERAIFDEFVDRFVDLAERLVVGDPTDPATDIGPLASEEHWQKVCRYFDIAEAEGAKLLTGGLHEGWWVRPTVLVNTTQEIRISHEEIFGPIVTIAPFDGEADAIRLANDSRYGLNAMVFTENARRAHRVARAVRAGTVWVNCYFVRDLRAPFGGFKDSGIGREGGKHSREFFTEAKTVVMEI